MEYTSIPIIVLICYLIGEGYKIIFKKKYHKLLPIVVTVMGGIMGILIYVTNKELLLNVNNIWQAIMIGILSGASSTTTKEIIKKTIKKEGEKDGKSI